MRKMRPVRGLTCLDGELIVDSLQGPFDLPGVSVLHGYTEIRQYRRTSMTDVFCNIPAPVPSREIFRTNPMPLPAHLCQAPIFRIPETPFIRLGDQTG